MKKLLLAVFIGIVVGVNLCVYGVADEIYNKYFVEEEVNVVPSVVEVIYVE